MSPPLDFSLFISADAHQSFSFFSFLSLSSLFIPTWIETVFLFLLLLLFRSRDYFSSRAFPIDISNGFSRGKRGDMSSYYIFFSNGENISRWVEKKAFFSLTKTRKSFKSNIGFQIYHNCFNIVFNTFKYYFFLRLLLFL